MFKKVGPIDVHLKKLLNDEFLEDRHGNDFSTSNVKESEAFTLFDNGRNIGAQ